MNTTWIKDYLNSPITNYTREQAFERLYILGIVDKNNNIAPDYQDLIKEISEEEQQ